MRLIITKLIALYIFIAFFYCGSLYGQSWSVDGFVSEMPSLKWANSENVILDNLIHNRFNIERKFRSNISFSLGIRNRLFLGGSINNDPTLKYIIGSDPGVIDLSMNVFSGKGYVLNSHIDRLSVNYDIGKVKAIFGRQRVEWGLGRVWNPNDIFNVYSFYQFDYLARPGMDGISFDYEISDRSYLSAVIKIDGNYDMTAAAMFNTQIKSTSFQIFSGILDQEDYVVGLGWLYEKNGFKVFNETSLFISMDNLSNTNTLISLGGRCKKEKVTVGAEYLFSEFQRNDIGDVSSIFNARTSIKNLSIADHSYDLFLGFEFAEHLNSQLDFIGYGYPLFQRGYISSTTNYLLKNNLILSSIVQYFDQSSTLDHESKAFFSVRLKKYF